MLYRLLMIFFISSNAIHSRRSRVLMGSLTFIIRGYFQKKLKIIQINI